jgi:hypothetical protein
MHDTISATLKKGEALRLTSTAPGRGWRTLTAVRANSNGLACQGIGISNQCRSGLPARRVGRLKQFWQLLWAGELEEKKRILLPLFRFPPDNVF